MSGQPTPTFQPNTDQNERLTFALQSAGIGTWDLDVLNWQVWWDDICMKLHGFGPDEFIPYEQVVTGVHPADQPMVRKAVEWALDPASERQYAKAPRSASTFPFDRPARNGATSV